MHKLQMAKIAADAVTAAKLAETLLLLLTLLTQTSPQLRLLTLQLPTKLLMLSW